jgi:hypothetical protein
VLSAYSFQTYVQGVEIRQRERRQRAQFTTEELIKENMKTYVNMNMSNRVTMTSITILGSAVALYTHRKNNSLLMTTTLGKAQGV